MWLGRVFVHGSGTFLSAAFGQVCFRLLAVAVKPYWCCLPICALALAVSSHTYLSPPDWLARLLPFLPLLLPPESFPLQRYHAPEKIK